MVLLIIIAGEKLETGSVDENAETTAFGTSDKADGNKIVRWSSAL